MRILLAFIIMTAAAAGDHGISIVNNTKVVNNLIMPTRLKPLVIDRPPTVRAPLNMRPFSFNQNMDKLPQAGNDYTSPFSGPVSIDQSEPFILNNVVIRKSKVINHGVK